MNIIDTHSHIYDAAFDSDIESIISRAKNIGVEYILLPNVDTKSIAILNDLSGRYPNYCIPMMGLHPTSITPDWMNDLATIKKQFDKHKYIAVGEIGIDLYWDKSLEKEQRAAFEEQLKWSIEYDLPVSIHCRNAIKESIECIKNVGEKKLRGVFHSFGGSKEELHEVLALENFYIGINGTVTYKNSILPTIIKDVDLNKLIVETDAPYLPPVPYRGKRNEPAYTMYTIDKLSEIFQLDKEEIARITTTNAKELFSLS